MRLYIYISLIIVILASCKKQVKLEQQKTSEEFFEYVFNNQPNSAWELCSDTLKKL